MSQYSQYNSPFNTDFQVTQVFGGNYDEYKRFGLAGHNGIDLIPSSSDWSIFSLEGGIVTYAAFDNGGFGNMVKVYNRETGHVWLYAHLAGFNIKAGDLLQKGDRIGTMGNTGNSTGPHLHLGLKLVTAEGTVLNNNNGYFGAVDPLLYLRKTSVPTPTQPTPTPKPVTGSTQEVPENNVNVNVITHMPTPEYNELKQGLDNFDSALKGLNDTISNNNNQIAAAINNLNAKIDAKLDLVTYQSNEKTDDDQLNSIMSQSEAQFNKQGAQISGLQTQVNSALEDWKKKLGTTVTGITANAFSFKGIGAVLASALVIAQTQGLIPQAYSAAALALGAILGGGAFLTPSAKPKEVVQTTTDELPPSTNPLLS